MTKPSPKTRPTVWRENRRRKDAPAPIEEPELRIFGFLPGAVMYLRRPPAGVPDTQSARSSHIVAARDAAPLASLATDEREPLFESLEKTVRRSEYHRLRYASLRAEVDKRRKNLPGSVFYDQVVEVLHFEAQSFCGAARMVLDEIMYIAARRAGAKPNKAKEKPWETSDLIAKTLPAGCDVSEVQIAREMTDWFDLLNAYRNTFFHHGWRYGSGHYDQGDQRAAALNPRANALLVPDRASLRGRRKANEWTYKDGVTIDDVMLAASTGLDALLKAVCERAWSTEEPAPGTLPRDKHPNLIVSVTKPAIFILDDLGIVALFTTEEKARSFGASNIDAPGSELVSVPIATSLVGQPAASLSLRGWSAPPEVKRLAMMIDPVITGPTQVTCDFSIFVEDEIAEQAKLHPVSLPVNAPLERLYTWQAVSVIGA